MNTELLTLMDDVPLLFKVIVVYIFLRMIFEVAAWKTKVLSVFTKTMVAACSRLIQDNPGALNTKQFTFCKKIQHPHGWSILKVKRKGNSGHNFRKYEWCCGGNKFWHWYARLS